MNMVVKKLSPWAFILMLVMLLGCTPTQHDHEATSNEEGQKHQEEAAGGNEYGAEISPDGQTVVLYSDRGTNGQARIYLVNVDGSGLAEIPYPDTGAWDVEPHWSPDGQQIAFTGHRQDGASIYIMNKDGSHLRKVEGVPDGFSMAGALDGQGGLYFFNWPANDSFEPNIYHIQLDGTGLRQLTHDQQSVQPRLGSDGRVYYSKQIGENQYHYMSMNAEGGNIQNISLASGYDFSFPALSADGIYFTIAENENTVLYKMDFDGQHARKVVELEIDLTAWFHISESESHMVYDFSGPSNMDLYKIDLRSGMVSKVVAD